MSITRRHLLASLPILGGAALGLGFHKILHNMQDGTFNPHNVQTGRVGKDAPNFKALPPLPLFGDARDHTLLTPQMLCQQEKPFLLNFLASWCIPCVTEIPFLKEISKEITIWGIIYKDKTERAANFLKRNGQPYEYIAQDMSGYCAIDWGVTGVPETFLILPGGKIAYHQAYALTQETYQNEIRPLLQKSF